MQDMSDRTFRLLAAALSLVMQIGARFQLLLIAPTGRIPPQWGPQLTFLLAVAAVLTVILPWLRLRALVYVFLAARFALVYLVGVPLGGYLGAETTLLAALVVEAFAHGTLRWSALAAPLGVAVFVVSQRSVNAWGQVLPAAEAHDILSLCLYMLVVIIAMGLLRAYRDKHVAEHGLYDRLNETSLRLADANTRLQEYAALKEEEATRSERKRVAQEIHDTLAYTLTNLIMMMEAGLSLTGPEDDELREVLSEARTQAKDGLGEVRKAVQTLQPTAVRRPAGLRAVYNLVQSIRKATGIRVDLHMGDVPWSFGEEADSVVFRFVQESITNAMRHGKASEVSVFLSRSNSGVQVTVRDDGSGSDHVEPGFGLKGMQDRLAGLGGTVSFYSQLNRGFRVEAWIPLPKEQGSEENQSAPGG